MRRAIAFGLVTGMILSVPVGMYAASGPAAGRRTAQAPGAIAGVAKDAAGKHLAAKVRVRNAGDGSVVSEVQSGADGAFSVSGLQPGNYIVEVLGPNGQVIGLYPTIAVTSGVTATITVTATAAGAVGAAGAGGGLSLFGLGTAATLGVIGAAATAAIVGVVATRNTASPSR